MQGDIAASYSSGSIRHKSRGLFLFVVKSLLEGIFSLILEWGREEKNIDVIQPHKLVASQTSPILGGEPAT